jgi:hypothetical protein
VYGRAVHFVEVGAGNDSALTSHHSCGVTNRCSRPRRQVATRVEKGSSAGGAAELSVRLLGMMSQLLSFLAPQPSAAPAGSLISPTGTVPAMSIRVTLPTKYARGTDLNDHIWRRPRVSRAVSPCR